MLSYHDLSSQEGMVVFAHILGWPPGGTIELGSPKPETGLTKV